MSTLTLVAALLLGQASAIKTLTLHVGETVPSPVTASVFTVCNDLTVVRVVDRGDHLELTGLKPGHTLCSFQHRPSMPTQLVDVTVLPAP